MTSLYSGVKVRYPLLGMMGGVAEGGVRSISHMAMKQATPLLQSLEPQSMCASAINANVANSVNATLELH